MRYFLFFLSIVVFVAGCRDKSGIGDQSAIDIFSYKDNEIDFRALVDTTSYRLVKLELTEGSLIGTVDKIGIIDDKIVILDLSVNKSVYMFDMEGKVIRQIGRKGRGPGEYSEAKNFVLDYDGGHVIVGDNSSLRQLFYDLDGRFIKEYRLRKNPMAYVDGRFFFASDPYGDGNSGKYEVTEIDTLGQIIGGYYPRKRFVEKPDGYYMKQFYFYQDENDCYFVPMFTDELHSLTKDGIELKYRFGFRDRAVDYDKSDRAMVLDENRFHNITKLAITDDMDYYFEVPYGTRETFVVYGNMESGKVEAASVDVLFKNPHITGPSSSARLRMSLGIIGSYKDEFISSFNPGYYTGILPDAKDTDNPYLLFFKLKI
jgi:hypothetical protein